MLSLLAVLAVSSSVAQVAAPSMETFEAAEAARVAMQGDQTLAKIVEALRKRLIEVVTQRGHVSPDKATVICDEVLMPAMKSHLPELGDALANIYARNFTVDELHALTAFYLTPLGQKMIERTPELAVESAAAGRDWGARVGRQAILDHLQLLRSKGVNL